VNTAASWVALAVGLPPPPHLRDDLRDHYADHLGLARQWAEGHLPDPLRGRRIVTLGQTLRGLDPRSPAYASLPSAAASLADFTTSDGAIVSTAAIASPSSPPLPRGSEARFGPSPFRARGEPVLAVLFPRPAAAHAAAGRLLFQQAGPGRLEAALPGEIEPGTPISTRLRLRLPRRRGRRPAAAGRRPGVDWTMGPASGGDTFISARRFRAERPPSYRRSARRRLQPRANGELFVWARP
jgi:hypothetical protein